VDYIAVVQMDVINREPNFIVCSIKVVDFVDKIDYRFLGNPMFPNLERAMFLHHCFVV
jgi:hypothetical protein